MEIKPNAFSWLGEFRPICTEVVKFTSFQVFDALLSRDRGCSLGAGKDASDVFQVGNKNERIILIFFPSLKKTSSTLYYNNDELSQKEIVCDG